jgi:hypothetical protein
VRIEFVRRGELDQDFARTCDQALEAGGARLANKVNTALEISAAKSSVATSSAKPETGSLDAFIAAAPWPQRTGLRALLAIARRPRGAALLARAAPLDQLPHGLLTVGRYDDPQVSRTLGWDAAAVLARGRELRRAEGRA